MSESTSHHDNLRDRIGQALNDAIASGAPQADYCDSREVDRLADAVLPLVADLERQRDELQRRLAESDEERRARWSARIAAAVAAGEPIPRDPVWPFYCDRNWLDGLAPSQWQASVQPKCKTCGGTGFVDDGEINHYPNGEPYMHGPVKCVKDCPDCGVPVPPAQAQQQAGALTDEQIRNVWLAMPGGAAGWLKEFGFIQFARAILAAAKGDTNEPR